MGLSQGSPISFHKSVQFCSGENTWRSIVEAAYQASTFEKARKCASPRCSPSHMPRETKTQESWRLHSPPLLDYSILFLNYCSQCMTSLSLLSRVEQCATSCERAIPPNSTHESSLRSSTSVVRSVPCYWEVLHRTKWTHIYVTPDLQEKSLKEKWELFAIQHHVWDEHPLEQLPFRDEFSSLLSQQRRC